MTDLKIARGGLFTTIENVSEHDAKIRNAALEEAAQAAEKAQRDYDLAPASSSYIAAAIRALKGEAK